MGVCRTGSAARLGRYFLIESSSSSQVAFIRTRGCSHEQLHREEGWGQFLTFHLSSLSLSLMARQSDLLCKRVAGLPFTERVERAHSYRARSASKKDGLATPSYLSEAACCATQEVIKRPGCPLPLSLYQRYHTHHRDLVVVEPPVRRALRFFARRSPSKDVCQFL